MGDRRPIGLFDSGIGGITVFEQVRRILPDESVIYFGDSANVPYGGRPVSELVALGDRIIRFLLSKKVKIVLFACNTSSSVSIGVLRERYPVPMIGLVEPGAQMAVRATRNGKVGLIATEATVKSESYPKAVAAIAPEVRVFSSAAPALVPLVEAGKVDTPEAEEALNVYLAPLKEAGVDTLILGCTHYPFFNPLISRILGPEVVLVDPAEATTIEARKELVRRGILTSKGKVKHEFYVSGDPEEFDRLAERFSSWRLPAAKKVGESDAISLSLASMGDLC
ncbi:MAG TPA: glutamate racemase [Desulfotomaculum sp.]|nr:glutamate racemase [Desulfotomaculum sp.]